MTALLIVLAIVVLASGASAVVLRSRRSRAALGAAPAPGAIAPRSSELGHDPDAPPPVPPASPVPPVATSEPTPAHGAAPVVSQAPVEPAPSVASASAKSRGLFASLRAARRLKAIEADTWDNLEATLLRADVGVVTTGRLLEALQASVAAGAITSGDQLVASLRELLIETFAATDGARSAELTTTVEAGRIPVWLVVGVNGVGKTTTIGKLAHRATAAGQRVLLAAGDTFRAAAGEQLSTWGERAEVDVVVGADGADPSAVVFDAVQRAKARGVDAVLADTAGRLHNKVNLVEELKKIRRVADREPGQVTEVLLVIDATTGQNALVQAKEFTQAVSVTGIVLSKFDGSARGGVAVAIEAELGIPVRFLGVGERAGDLVAFDPAAFVDALLADDPVA